MIVAASLASAQTGIQPGRDIKWPASCLANMLYVPASNTCTSVGGAPILSALLPATAVNSIQNGNFAQVWNWILTGTVSECGLCLSEVAGQPSTNTGPSSIIFGASTTAGSTVSPLQAEVHDGTGGIKVDPNGDLHIIGQSNRLYGAFGSLFQSVTSNNNFNLWSGAHWNGSSLVADVTGTIFGVNAFGGTMTLSSNAGVTAGVAFNPDPIMSITPNYPNSRGLVLYTDYAGTAVGTWFGSSNSSPAESSWRAGAHPNGATLMADVTGNVSGIGFYGATTTISSNQGVVAGQAFTPSPVAAFGGLGAYLWTGIQPTNGLQHRRNNATCATAATAWSSCPTSVSWNPVFVDANYTVSCSFEGIQGGTPLQGAISVKNGSTVTVLTYTPVAAGAQFQVLDCIAMHD